MTSTLGSVHWARDVIAGVVGTGVVDDDDARYLLADAGNDVGDVIDFSITGNHHGDAGARGGGGIRALVIRRHGRLPVP